jgi:hypothetical protein
LRLELFLDSLFMLALFLQLVDPFQIGLPRDLIILSAESYKEVTYFDDFFVSDIKDSNTIVLSFQIVELSNDL